MLSRLQRKQGQGNEPLQKRLNNPVHIIVLTILFVSCLCRYIVGVDLMDSKFAAAKEMGADLCVNPSSCEKGDVKPTLLAKEKWGYDYTFDCTGVVQVMRTALEVAHRGWGESCIIGKRNNLF